MQKIILISEKIKKYRKCPPLHDDLYYYQSWALSGFFIFLIVTRDTPWREGQGPDDRWIQYKVVIHMNVLLHSIIICPLH